MNHKKSLKNNDKRLLGYIWKNIKSKCLNKTNHKYKIYGGRGITVCKDWQDNFEKFYNWSIVNGYKQGLTIDRIDNNGNYEPSNCRWTTQKVQQNNRRDNHLITYNGKTQTLSQWSEESKIKSSTIRMRLSTYKWSIEKSLTYKK